jgi:multiple sugar transport system substrate-binding protein
VSRSPFLSLCSLCLCGAVSVPSIADDLVTPIRLGREDAPLRLTVWLQQDYSHLASRPPTKAIFTAIFEEWARARPDVRLDLSVMPALELQKAKLMLAAASGRLPDVASVDSFWMPLFTEGGHVQPLNQDWPAEDRADFLPFTTRTLSDAEGNIYGIWHGTDCRLLYYRKDLVPQPPRTWAELLDVASRIARERKIAGYIYNAGRWEAAVFDHLPMFWAQGGELVDERGQPVFGLPPHREKLVKVMAFLRDTVKTGASPRSVLGHTDYQQLTDAATAGDAAMFLGGSWQVPDLRNRLSPQEFAKWDGAPIPQAEASLESTGTGGWVWVSFARDPARRRAAVEFMRFVESRANVPRINMANGQLPVRLSAYRDFPFFRDDPWYRKFGELLVHAKARPTVPLYPSISEQLQLAVGYAVSGDKTPEEAVDGAWRAVQRIAAAATPGRAAAPRFDPLAVLPALLAAALVAAVLWPLAASLRGWLLPALALVAALLLYPMFDLLRLSATNTRTHGIAYHYGLSSFANVLRDPAFYGMLAVTVAFVAGSVVLQLGLGLLIAVLVDSARRSRLRGTLGVRAAVVSAWVVPGVLVGVLWRILLIENRSGVVNYVLSLAHMGPLPLLSSSMLALLSVILANAWRGCAFSMVLQYAGLQRIPRELHEAADLEGLSPWQRFRMVTVPQIAPVLALNLAVITIATLNTFDLILPLTGGGPARSTEVISLFMYRAAFFNLEAGRAAAVGVIMLALNLALAVFAVRFSARRKAA